MQLFSNCIPQRRAHAQGWLRHVVSPLCWCMSALALTAAHATETDPEKPRPGVLRLAVDATDLTRHIVRIRETLAVAPGPLRLLFPLWLPGEHGPNGRVVELAGLVVRSDDGQTLPWRRDPLDPHAFVLEVPAGVRQISLAALHLGPVQGEGRRLTNTEQILTLAWRSLLLYPAGQPANTLPVEACARLPAQWSYATALRAVTGVSPTAASPAADPADEPGKGVGDTVCFAPVSLEHFIDSPLYAAQHARHLVLADGKQPVLLHVFADQPRELEHSPDQLIAHQRLVQQADKLFGMRPFAHYDFLLTISADIGRAGLEHHQSSENSVRPGYFKDWDQRGAGRDLLAHEYVHAWNGKHRRPADLTTPDFNTPMQNSLLWVYEGQTQFWGLVLATRAGLLTRPQALDALARVAATYSERPGRQWRALQDTTNDGTMGPANHDKDWPDYQRGQDYYDEALLFWLEADMVLRERSGGRRGLDDFARAFFGAGRAAKDAKGANDKLGPETYTFDDVVAALNALTPWDWAAWLRRQLDAVGKAAPDKLEGLHRAGWRLAWQNEPSPYALADAEAAPALSRSDDFTYSLGLRIEGDGKVQAVRWGSPAFALGLTRGAHIVAVGGVPYTAELLREAVQANTAGAAPIELLVRQNGRYQTRSSDYRGGLRYPVLERISERPDLLGALLEAR